MKCSTYTFCMMMKVWYMEICYIRPNADKRNTIKQDLNGEMSSRKISQRLGPCLSTVVTPELGGNLTTASYHASAFIHPRGIFNEINILK